MLSLLSGAIALAKWLWGLFHPAKADPTTDQLVASNVEAQDQLSQERTANAVNTQADATRIAGDVAVVRILAAAQPGAIDSTANAAIARQFPGAVSTD